MIARVPFVTRTRARFLIYGLTVALTSSSELVADDESIAFFERRVRPALVKHCYECHSAKTAELGGGLMLDNRAAVAKGATPAR